MERDLVRGNRVREGVRGVRIPRDLVSNEILSCVCAYTSQILDPEELLSRKTHVHLVGNGASFFCSCASEHASVYVCAYLCKCVCGCGRAPATSIVVLIMVTTTAGGMVNLLRQALLELGMPGSHVTHEIYFNHKEQPDRAELSRIVDTLRMPPARIMEWSGAET
jgi:hypothetical protein